MKHSFCSGERLCRWQSKDLYRVYNAKLRKQKQFAQGFLQNLSPSKRIKDIEINFVESTTTLVWISDDFRVRNR